MAEKISVEIALEGGKEVERQLADIGKAGQKAFADISKSAEQAGGFKNLDPGEVTNKLEQFGVTGVEAINKIKAAVQSGVQLESIVQGVGAVEAGFAAVGIAAVAAGIALGVIAGAALVVGAALLPVVSSAAQASDALAQVADASNSSMQSVSNLANVFAEAGVKTNEFSNTIGKLAEESNKAFESMGAGAQQAADRISQAEQRVEDAHDHARDAANRQREAEVQRTIQMEQSALASERSALASRRAADAAAGLTEEHRRGTAALEEQIRGHQRYISSVQDKLHAMQAEHEATRNSANMLRAFNEEQRAAHALAQASANDLATLAQAWKDLAEGIGGTFDPLATFENKIKALKAVLGEIGALGGDINARMLFLSEVLSKLPIDKALELGKALGLTRQEVLLLHKGYENFLRLLERQAKLGLGLTDQDRKNLDEFTAAWNRLSTIISEVAIKIGALVAPAFTAVFNIMTAAIEKVIFGVQTLMSWLGKLGQTPVGQLLITMFNILVTVISTTISVLITLASWLIKIAATPIGLVLYGAFILLNGAISLVVSAISTLFSWLAQLAQTPVGQALITVFGFIVGVINAVITGVSTLISWLAQLAQTAFGQAVIAAFTLINDVINAVITGVSWLIAKFQELEQTPVGQAVIAGINLITQAINIAAAAIANAIALLARFLSMGGGRGPPSGAPAPAKAAGGLLGGRGTGTSDSNLAWVSRGEHIMPARAVAQPGVLAFLEALRRSGGNLSAVLDGMGRFALGGIVPRHAMAFAGGGMVGGANLGTLTLGLPSGGSVSVRASANTVEQLRQEAALAQVRSGGRKPSRYS